MPAFIETSRPSGIDVLVLEGQRLTLGKGPGNDIDVSDDTKVSHRHAVLERYGDEWSIRDIGSKNGTYVNGERLASERMLRPGDEIRVGSTSLLYRSEQVHTPETETEAEYNPPDLTRRQRDVLVSLCRPVLSDNPFTDPATVKEIAQELVVTEAAVKQHLLRMYDKFGVHEQGERRRLRLANEAIRRGAVTIADLRRSS